MSIQRIQFRRGTTAQWASENPILALGEPGIELKVDNSVSMKIGDGATAWLLLPYVYSDDLVNQADLDSAIAALVNSAPTTLDTLNEIATALGDDPSFATTITTALGNKSDIGHTHSVSEITDITATASELNTLDGITATVDDLNATSGANSNFQTQLDTLSTDVGTLQGDVAERVNTVNGTVTTANTGLTVVRNITLSTSDPSGGADGDVWLKYVN